MENAMVNRWTSELPSKYIKGSQREQFLAVGEKRGFGFVFLGTAPVPEAPVYVPGWWIIPAEQDRSQVPAKSLQRIRSLFAVGLRPAAFVIVHEVPQALPNPAIPSSNVEGMPERAMKTRTGAKNVLDRLLSAASLVLPLTFFAGLALIDPILVAITDDLEWIEIDRWDVESR